MLDVIVVGAGLRYGARAGDEGSRRREDVQPTAGVSAWFSTPEVFNLEGIRDQSIQFSLDRNADLTNLDEVTVEQYVKNRCTIPKTVKMVNL
ncbi:Flavin-containing amine oxidase [Neofusicoccum parvum]|uniref:Flavin-containing amine oxidase n=1 Tax=Neofusicoccum parvum TaxID=310453 RepID=A0ACB5SAE2_9PEZI|nr:Flavin-containing amine oxidase [Neofusicoccum parvum]